MDRNLPVGELATMLRDAAEHTAGLGGVAVNECWAVRTSILSPLRGRIAVPVSRRSGVLGVARPLEKPAVPQ